MRLDMAIVTGRTKIGFIRRQGRDRELYYVLIYYGVCFKLFLLLVLVPWAIQVYQALDRTILIVSEILFRLAQHDAL